MLTGRSLGLALAASALAVIAALLLSIAKRWSQARWLRGLTFLAGMGYTIPGAVLAWPCSCWAAPGSWHLCCCCFGATATSFWPSPKRTGCSARTPVTEP